MASQGGDLSCWSCCWPRWGSRDGLQPWVAMATLDAVARREAEVVQRSKVMSEFSPVSSAKPPLFFFL